MVSRLVTRTLGVDSNLLATLPEAERDRIDEEYYREDVEAEVAAD
jgi:hypothetical protein